jgi:hypothetical protein
MSQRLFSPSPPLAPPPSWMDERYLTGIEDAEWHIKNTPTVSLTQYAQERRKELAKTLCQKRRIYLDQRYWIHWRDAAEGRAAPVYCEIWRMLKDLVRDGIAVCPISSLSIFETFKQVDSKTRVRTAEIMDELSTGIAMRSPSGRRTAEFSYLLRQSFGSAAEGDHPINQAFTWILEAFGDLRVRRTAQSAEEAEAIGKAAFDSFRRMRFPDLLQAMPDWPQSMIFGYDADSRDHHNRISSQYSWKRHNFAQRLQREIEGTRAWLNSEIARNFLVPSGGSELQAYQLCDRFMELLDKKHAPDGFIAQLPSLHLRCVIYAAIDHKHRRFSKGDAYDHDHAVAALPYCNVFLTERKLGTLLTEKPAQLDKISNCRVIWNNDEALTELQSLSRGT